MVVLGIVFCSFLLLSYSLHGFPLSSMVLYYFPAQGQLWESLGLSPGAGSSKPGDEPGGVGWVGGGPGGCFP